MFASDNFICTFATVITNLTKKCVYEKNYYLPDVCDVVCRQ